jgi:dienelactone hydrolase
VVTAACPAYSACTATAAFAPLALSSWSTSVLIRVHALPGFGLRTTQVAPRQTSWLVKATWCWYTTPSPGEVGGLTCPIPRPGSPRCSTQSALWHQQGVSPTADEWFDMASDLHENTVAKAAGVLGQTFSGAVLTDDLVAFGVLAAEDGVDPARLGTFGFSGGGGRSLLLAALDHRVAASAVSCVMATFASLIPSELDTHSWLLHVPGLWSLSDWPDLTAMGRARFLIQYRTDDELFPRAGMEAAHDHLLRLHAGTGRYRGSFTPGGHAFDTAMQEEAWAFLAQAL